jgi:transposase
MLDYQPAKFFRRQIIRRKFVRRDEASLLPSSLHCLRACSSAVSQHRVYWHKCSLVNITIINRLYRQEQIYWDRHQVCLPRQSMTRRIQLASEWLKPIYREIKEHDPTYGSWKEELVVFWSRRCWPTQCDHLFDHRKLSMS